MPRFMSRSSNQGVSPDMLKGFAQKAVNGYGSMMATIAEATCAPWPSVSRSPMMRVLITGSKSELLRTLVAASTVETAAFGIHSSVLKWRAGTDEDENFELLLVL